MKKNAQTIAFMVAALFFICSNTVIAQNMPETLQTGNPNSKTHTLKSALYNFTSFSKSYKKPDEKWLENNKGYTTHPDAGFVTTNDPTPNAIEIISKRTSDSKYYIDKDTASKFYIVKANQEINYQKNGQWLSIDKRLMPGAKNIFEASHQQEPVGFDLDKKRSYIKTIAGTFYFNNWQLSGEDASGEKVLAKADWSSISEGDGGVKIINIFPGIDAEMIVDKGSVKTNFIIKQNKFTSYQQLVFTDEFNSTGASETGEMQFSDDQSKVSEQGEVDFSFNKKTIAHINKAIMYAQKDPAKTYQYLTYKINKNHLSILIDAINLNQQLLNGNVIIDPLVSSTATLSVASITGSMNNGNVNNACKYPFTIATPAKVTFTNVAVEFGLTTTSPAVNKDAIFFIIANNCDTVGFSANVNDPGYNESGNLITVDSTGASGFASIPPILNCLTAPSCVPQNITFVLGLFNTVTSGPDNICSNQYVSAYEPFQLLIQGRTIEMKNIIASPATICQGNVSVLSASAQYGVPPYVSYNWSNGVNGRNIIVTPSATTTYSVSIVDQCNDIATDSIIVNVVDPVTPTITISTPNTTVCQGSSVVFTANPTSGGNAPSYQWHLNGNPVGTNTNTYANNNLATGDKINCVLTSNYFCVTTNIANSDTLTMTVVPNIVPTINIMSSTNNFCFGKNVTFIAHTSNVGPSPSYQWYINGNPVGTNDSIYTNNTLLNNDKVTCIASVSNTGCYTVSTVTSNIITAVVYSIPTITFSPDSIILARYDTAKINSIITGNIGSFEWTPTTGLINPESETPIADPVVTTVYQLSVTSVNDCVDSNTITIQVYDKIFIPNAFAPDGKNNIFRIPPGITFNLENFSIYDRWGNKVFTTSDINRGWDGTIEGQNASAGVYVYVIYGSDLRGKVLDKGTVTLLR
ncbi:MAG TPA: gliding motility-associated C-terminal domain-containing protein [Ferruginibacter sp.]|nr:gliding motility-associated C-terminal domain-containing protein [Ferruginibacter sp.]